MRYEFFTTETEARNTLKKLQDQGFRGYVLRLSKNDFELRYWPA